MNIFETPLTKKSQTQDGVMKKATTIKTGQEIFDFFRENSNKLKEEDFIGLEGREKDYSAKRVEADKKRVEFVKMSEDYEEQTPHGKVLENLMSKVMEECGWFSPEGGEAHVRQTAEFDDIIESGAHADAVVEIRTANGSIVAFGLDFTTAEHPDRLNKKRTRYLESAKHGKLFNVKYFQSDMDGYRGPLESVPVFAVGIDKENVAKFCQDYGQNSDMRDNFFQYIIFEEIAHQIDRLIAHRHLYAMSQDKLIDTLELYREILLEIGAKKSSLRPSDFGAKAAKDGVFSFIDKYF